MTMIGDNLQTVRARIATACQAARRDAGAVTLLAVSKTFGPEAVREAFAAGQTAFGENYLQEAVDKMSALRDLPLQWHCIGPIQSNKTRLVAEHFSWAHTIDRLRVAQRLNDQRPPDLAPLQVCVQVNIDAGPTKSGVAPQDALWLVREVAELPRLQVRGLMTIPDSRPDFQRQVAVHAKAKDLFDAIAAAGGRGLDHFDTLSMGMTADLEAAIQAGSTMVRIGTAIFGGRPKP
ncbi:MAG: YggS family pyridoxal phosphate-dependent enzyme [Rhodoferax sp.]